MKRLTLKISVSKLTENNITFNGFMLYDGDTHSSEISITWSDPPVVIKERFIKEAKRIFGVLPEDIALIYG